MDSTQLFVNCEYELCFSISTLIEDALRLASAGSKVAVFLDMDRTVTRGIISDPDYQITPEDIREGVLDGIEALIAKGCIVSVLTARGNGTCIARDGNGLLNRYPTDLVSVLGPLWRNHKAFSLGDEFVSKQLKIGRAHV